jgi:hypothetical protein
VHLHYQTPRSADGNVARHRETRRYIGEVNDDQMPILEQCLNAAVAYIGYVATATSKKTTTTSTSLPDNVREATLRATSRLFRRRLSPEGSAGSGSSAQSASLSRPDIERLITPQRSWGFA